MKDQFLAFLCGTLWSAPWWIGVGWLWSKTEFRIIPLRWSERLDGEADINRSKR